MALTVTITNAGRAELINAQNTGTTAAVIDRIGVSSTHVGGDLKTLTVLPNERKRLSTFGGEVVADDVIHVTINDETADTYTLRAFGLYFSSGTLFAVCTSAEPIMEKAAAAMLLQAVDITLTTLDTANIAFGGTGFTNPPATTERLGVVELATAEETIAGTDAVRAVTPYGLARAFAAWAANFAAKIHNHGIGDIADLGTALAGKAPKIHDHDAADTKTGVFAVDRIPKLPISWITNLTETLADKASALHSHTMAQVSGLVAALALKADLNSPDITGYPRLPAVTLFKKEFANSSEGGQLRLEKPDKDTALIGNIAIDINGNELRIYEEAAPYKGISFPIPDLAPGAASYPWTNTNFDPATKAQRHSPGISGTAYLGQDKVGQVWIMGGDDRAGVVEWRVNGQRVGFMGYGDGPNGNPFIGADGDKVWVFNKRPSFNGFTPWDTGNFNPATKANVQYPDFFGQINLETGPARFRAIGDGDSLFIQAGTATSNNGNLILSGLNGQNLTSLRVQIGGALRDIFHTGNFSPASKVDVYNTDGYPHAISLGWSGSRMVARVDNAAATPGHALVHLADAASAAEAAAGTATDRFITPAALWSFAKSYGPTGRQHFPGTDLMIQWGVSTATMAEGQAHTFLPIAFPGGCLWADAIPLNPASTLTMDFFMQHVASYQDRIVYYANRANGGAGNMTGYRWLAIGLVKGNPDPVFYEPGGGDPGGGGGGGPITQV